MKNAFSICSRAIAVYFIWALHLHVGFPPTGELTSTAATYLAMVVFFLVLPFTQRLKIGKLIEFEAKVEAVQKAVDDVRTETRQLVSTVSAVATAISTSVNQNVFVNLPTEQAAQVARKEISESLTHASAQAIEPNDVSEYFLSLGDADMHFALARLRMDLEKQMRRILGRRLLTSDPTKMKSKFLGARTLFRRLVSAKSRYSHMENSFDYVLNVCNAAIHGQQISTDVALEALGMGLQMLREFEHETVA